MAACRSMLTTTLCKASKLALQAQRQRDLYQNLLTKLNKRLGDTLEAMSAERRSLMDTAEVLTVQSWRGAASWTPVSDWLAGVWCMLPNVQLQTSLWEGSTGLH